jgi:hypothetical protein
MQKIGNEWYEVFTGIDGMKSKTLFGGGGRSGESAPSQGTTASENGVVTLKTSREIVSENQSCPEQKNLDYCYAAVFSGILTDITGNEVTQAQIIKCNPHPENGFLRGTDYDAFFVAIEKEFKVKVETLTKLVVDGYDNRDENAYKISVSLKSSKAGVALRVDKFHYEGSDLVIDNSHMFRGTSIFYNKENIAGDKAWLMGYRDPAVTLKGTKWYSNAIAGNWGRMTWDFTTSVRVIVFIIRSGE